MWSKSHKICCLWAWKKEQGHKRIFWEDGNVCDLIGVWATQVPAFVKLVEVYTYYIYIALYLNRSSIKKMLF